MPRVQMLHLVTLARTDLVRRIDLRTSLVEPSGAIIITAKCLVFCVDVSGYLCRAHTNLLFGTAGIVAKVALIRNRDQSACKLFPSATSYSLWSV